MQDIITIGRFTNIPPGCEDIVRQVLAHEALAPAPPARYTPSGPPRAPWSSSRDADHWN